jgi:hypothetical protein
MILFCRTADNGERSVYDRFRVEQFEVKTAGLYRIAGAYYILCPDAGHGDLVNANKYLDEMRYIGNNITAVSSLPTGSVEVPDRTPDEVIHLTGISHTRSDLASQVHMAFHRVLTEYKIQIGNPYILVFHRDEIDESVKSRLQVIVDTLAITFRFKFEKVHSLDTFEEEVYDDPFLGDIVVSRFSMNGYSANVKNLSEDDEDFWIDNRKDVFANSRLNKTSILTTEWSEESSKALIDINSGQTPQNILNLLSIYEKTIFVAPGALEMDSFLSALKLSKTDLVKLVEKKRIQFILPNNLKHYDKHFIEQISEANPQSVLLTRRLAAATVNDLRNRNPLLFPTVSVKERQAHLKSLNRLSTKLSDSAPDQIFLKALIAQLPTIWYSYPEVIQTAGARGTNMFGISRILSTLLGLKEMQTVYFDEASRIVEWSAALEANLIPHPFFGKNIEPLYRTTSLFYSGLPTKDWIPANFEYANLAIEKLLVVDDDVPPVEFATSFSNADINRFRKQIFDISRHKRSPEELLSSIELFNSWVKQYDRSRNTPWDISGFVLDLVEIPTGIPFFSWTVERIHMLMRKYGVESEGLGDFMDSLATDTVPSAVLVSRMRQQLADKWKESRY